MGCFKTLFQEGFYFLQCMYIGTIAESRIWNAF